MGFAKYLDGTNIGRLIKYSTTHWRDEDGKWQNSLKHVMGPITMITHKKDGGVNVRVGKHSDCPFGTELTYGPDDLVLLFPEPEDD